MLSTNLKRRPQGLDGKLKLIATALPVFAAVAYPIGFVLLNVVYSMWGFTDLQVLHVQCFFVVGWNCLLMLLASLPVFLFLSLSGTQQRAKRSSWKKVGLVALFFLLGIAGVAIWVWAAHHPEQARNLIRDHVEAIWFWLIVLPGGFALIVPVGMVQDNRRLRDVPMHEWAAGTLGVVFATLFFSIAYFFVLASWGGGMPQPRTYLVPPRAIAYLAPYNWSAHEAESRLRREPPGTAREFIPVEGLSLIHEGSDRIVLLSPPCQKLLRLPKEWFQYDVWDTPRPESPSTPETSCPPKDPATDSKALGDNVDAKSMPGANQKSDQAVPPMPPKK